MRTSPWIAFASLTLAGCAATPTSPPSVATAKCSSNDPKSPEAQSSAPAAASPASPRVTGIGGVFFKANDPKKLTAWYVEQLGFSPSAYGVRFTWREDDGAPGSTTWSIFPKSTTYFDPTVAPFMINYRVKNLDEVLARLRKAGARVDDKIDQEPYGRFGWAVDPEGNRFELWEPKAGP
jgi:predicted enzyme related to lactoylglutathione lyase